MLTGKQETVIFLVLFSLVIVGTYKFANSGGFLFIAAP
jgi:hypothetical protein